MMREFRIVQVDNGFIVQEPGQMTIMGSTEPRSYIARSFDEMVAQLRLLVMGDEVPVVFKETAQ